MMDQDYGTEKKTSRKRKIWDTVVELFERCCVGQVQGDVCRTLNILVTCLRTVVLRIIFAIVLFECFLVVYILYFEPDNRPSVDHVQLSISQGAHTICHDLQQLIVWICEAIILLLHSLSEILFLAYDMTISALAYVSDETFMSNVYIAVGATLEILDVLMLSVGCLCYHSLSSLYWIVDLVFPWVRLITETTAFVSLWCLFTILPGFISFLHMVLSITIILLNFLITLIFVTVPALGETISFYFLISVMFLFFRWVFLHICKLIIFQLKYTIGKLNFRRETYQINHRSNSIVCVLYHNILLHFRKHYHKKFNIKVPSTQLEVTK